MIPTYRLTVGLPVYNCERFLRYSLDGLLAQTYQDFALVISDNASTDATQSICEDYARRDPRIRYIRQQTNRGAAWNFNELLRQAEAPLFCWHAADDRAEPTYLEACIAALERNPQAALAYTEAVPIDADGNGLRYQTSPLVGAASTVTSERFAACLDPFPYPENVFHGVMRMEQVRKTRMLAAFGGCDRAFSAELGLYGPFVRVNEALFHRRVRIEKQSEAEFQQYNSGKRIRYPLREWRILLWNLQSVQRAPCPPEGRRRMYRAMLRRLVKQRSVYAYELKLAVALMGGLR